MRRRRQHNPKYDAGVGWVGGWLKIAGVPCVPASGVTGRCVGSGARGAKLCLRRGCRGRPVGALTTH